MHVTFWLRSSTKFSGTISVQVWTADSGCQKLDQLKGFGTQKLGGRHSSTQVSVHLCEIQNSRQGSYTLKLHRQSQLSKISQKSLYVSAKPWRISKWKELEARTCFTSSLSLSPSPPRMCVCPRAAKNCCWALRTCSLASTWDLAPPYPSEMEQSQLSQL